ncbi:DNA adenine methylase [Pedobacter sp. R20-19]|uniref:DNA adenine methylase n=1 Tax=Pedobacter sp. R20-19 TaxID=1270196 RepID=UPI000493AF39|nr:DNA adenine methylase [Pedobacter sp. R20-19]
MSRIKLPVTRYYGSKRKLITQIWDEFEKLGIEFTSTLDVFGGSGIFSYFSKTKGKSVIYNDIFKFNCINAHALIGNCFNHLSKDEALDLLEPKAGRTYKSFVAEHYKGIYFPEIENNIIDIAVQNIQHMNDLGKRNAAFYLLIQSCLIKRPYNLFHRKNLNLRTNFTGGNFGNKTTWERSFSELFERFNKELDEFCIKGVQLPIILNSSALECKASADLVYIDPPYFRKNGHVSYHSRYHFLEGLVNYDEIEVKINFNKNHHEIIINKSSEFENKDRIINDFDNLLKMHSSSIIVISYRNTGIPSIEELGNLVRKYKNNVRLISLGDYTYALSHNKVQNVEFLIIGY